MSGVIDTQRQEVSDNWVSGTTLSGSDSGCINLKQVCESEVLSVVRSVGEAGETGRPENRRVPEKPKQPSLHASQNRTEPTFVTLVLLGHSLFFEKRQFSKNMIFKNVSLQK